VCWSSACHGLPVHVLDRQVACSGATCRAQLGATEGAAVRGIIRPASLMTCFSIVTIQMLAFLLTPVMDVNARKTVPVANDVHSIVLLIQSTAMQVISALRSQETPRALPATAVTDLLTLVRLDSKSLHCLAVVMSASSWQNDVSRFASVYMLETCSRRICV
jgi:hypothetical protein